MISDDNKKIALELGFIHLGDTLKNQMMVSCIFHKDIHPSCSLNLDKGLYNCFSCGRHGSLRSLYKEIKGKDIEIKEKTKIYQFDIKNNNEIEDLIITFYNVKVLGQAAWMNSLSRRYLEKRGITKKVSEEMNMQFGSISYTDNDGNNYIYKDKLIIPISENGRIISYEVREVLTKEEFTKQHPNVEYKKCLYLKGSSTNTLYDLQWLDFEHDIYFTEGLLDLAVLRTCSKFNKFNSTTIFGCNITRRQKLLLAKAKYLNYIIDNDVAGIKSAMSLANSDIIKKSWKLLIPPVKCKDIGEIKEKLGKTIEQVYDNLICSGFYLNDDIKLNMLLKSAEAKK